MRERGGIRRVAQTAAMRATAVAILLLALLATVACDRPAGPAPVAWDRTRCDHCGMLVSDPAWAAQRLDPERGVTFYDDPGCLLVSLEADELGGSDGDGPRGTLWFHHHRDDVWLADKDVAFVPAGPSPMGYGLGAVARSEAGAADALGLDAARERALAIDRERGAP